MEWVGDARRDYWDFMEGGKSGEVVVLTSCLGALKGRPYKNRI